jgi:DNA/RNA endonuclease G (NUC1)
LAANADFVYGAFQRSTFYFVNCAPQWQTFNGANWAQLEASARDYASSQGNDLIVYTGTHGTTTLDDVNGNPADIHIAYDSNGNGVLRVPAFFWKIVYEPSSQRVRIFALFIYLIFLTRHKPKVLCC